MIKALQKQLEAKDSEAEARVKTAELEVRKEMQDNWKAAFDLGFEKCTAQLKFAKELLGSGGGGSSMF